MKNINEVNEYIIKSGKLADINVLGALGNFVKFVENELVNRAPVDSGDFRDSWESSSISKTSKGVTARITNDKIYADAIEFGSTPGESPWPNPGPKTRMSGGRIYSSQAVGGTIKKALSDKNINEFAKKIANSILMAFKQ